LPGHQGSKFFFVLIQEVRSSLKVSTDTLPQTKAFPRSTIMLMASCPKPCGQLHTVTPIHSTPLSLAGMKHSPYFEEPDVGSLFAPFSIEAFDPGQVTLPLLAFPVVKRALLWSSYYLPHRPHVPVSLPIFLWKLHGPVTPAPRDETITRTKPFLSNKSNMKHE
jgi:hypothetical protein